MSKKKVQKQKPRYMLFAVMGICFILSLVFLIIPFIREHQITSAASSPDTHETSLKGIHPLITEWQSGGTRDIVFSYEDVGSWQMDHQLVQIAVHDLPREENMIAVQTPLSYSKVSQFPQNDYAVTGLPWKVLITNSHSRGLYEVLKNDPKVFAYTFINWDFHDDVIPDNKDFIFSPEFITVANWVAPAYYYGRAKAPLYWYNCYAQPPDTEYPYPGIWDMKLPLKNGEEVQLPGEIINVTPDTSIALEYFDKTIREADDHSVWLSLCGDCFSIPGDTSFDRSSFRAKMLESILEIAKKYPDKIAFIHFARSPDYSGDTKGLNQFFVEQLQSL